MISRKVLCALFLLPLIVGACGLGRMIRGGRFGGPVAAANDDDVEFRRAQELHTAPAYRRYLSRFPAGRHTREARFLTERIAYFDASARMRPAALKAFLRKFPTSEFASGAQEELQRVEFRRLRQADEIEGYRAFLKRYKKAPTQWTASATQRLERLLLDRAKASGNELTLSRYIHDNPGTPYMNEARDALREAAFNRVMRSRDPDDWKAVLRRYRRTREAMIVGKHMEAEELRSAERAGTASALESYLKRYPDTPHRGRILASLSLMARERSRHASRWVKVKNAEMNVFRPRRCRTCRPTLQVRGTLASADKDFAYDVVLEVVVIEKGKRCCKTTHRIRGLGPGERKAFAFTVRGKEPKGPPPAFELRILEWSAYRAEAPGTKEPPREIQTSGKKAPVDRFAPQPVPPLGRR